MRICIKCNAEKQRFVTKNVCVDCKKIQKKIKYEQNKEKINKRERDNLKILKETNPEAYREYRSKVNKQNKENNLKNGRIRKRVSLEQKRNRANEYAKIYRQQNKDIIYANNKKYRENNEELKQKKKEYYEKNKDIINSKRRQNKTKKVLTESEKIVNLIRGRMNTGFRTFSKTGKVKSCSQFGIDFQAIVDKLGHRPSKDHHLDHIIPLSRFDFSNDSHVYWCNHPENLRWLEKIQNLRKHKKIIPELIKGNLVLESICEMLGIVL